MIKQNTLNWNPCWQSKHWGTEAGGSQVLGQNELHREVKVILGYKVRLCLKTKRRKWHSEFLHVASVPRSASGTGCALGRQRSLCKMSGRLIDSSEELTAAQTEKKVSVLEKC